MNDAGRGCMFGGGCLLAMVIAVFVCTFALAVLIALSGAM